MIREIKFTSESTTEPITLSEAKAYLQIDSGITGNDTLITSLIKAAREKLERVGNLSLIDRTVTVLVDMKDRISFELPYCPLNSITSVTEKSVDGDTVLASGTGYYKHGTIYPEIELTVPASGDVEFVYTTSKLSNETVKLAVKQAVADWYANRGDESTNGSLMSEQLSQRSIETIMRVSRNVTLFF